MTITRCHQEKLNNYADAFILIHCNKILSQQDGIEELGKCVSDGSLKPHQNVPHTASNLITITLEI